MSNVGNRKIYEADDQQTISQAEIEQKKDNRFHEGKDNSHKANDSSAFHYGLAILSSLTCNFLEDERSIANRLEREKVCVL
jgi:hypothetical protein